MSQPPSFLEELISQIPALRLLMAMGYTYLTPLEADIQRRGRRSNVVLEEVLEGWLAAHNHVAYKGRRHPFSEANVRAAIQTLTGEPLSQGLIQANQRVYELLTLGVSLRETIDGDAKSYTLHYIDWQHPENNLYHVTDEYAVEKPGSHETRRPDIVLFVNGIPLAVIECKRPDLEAGGRKAFEEAVTQMIRNQKQDEIPNLFVYSQLLFAISVNDAYYGTTCTPKPFWTPWVEEGLDEGALSIAANRRFNELEKEHLYGWREGGAWVRRHFDRQDVAGERLPTPQDRTLYAMLRPARLLELVYQFLVYDGGKKKIARHQQYFAVKETVARVAHLNHQGTRTGGVIWHTTGSGKSLTMVWLAKALALHPNVRNPRVVIVTDRVNLDAQIWNTFRACGKSVQRAKSGRDLAAMIDRGNVDIITTVIDKFDTASRVRARDEGVNVFCLVDESHRSQYGEIHAKMRRVLPKACYIGFTGTPLLKQEKSTARRFGGFIHTYSMRRAVEDGAVAPLLYEGRMAELAVDQEGIDRWFERVTRDLTDEQKRDLKLKFSRAEEISKADQRLQQIAYDLGEHYAAHFQGTGFKAQLATASKAVAIKYKRCLDDFGMITSEVVISPPDTREGNEEVDGETPEQESFWKRMMERFGSEEQYNVDILNDFARADGVELLIVVDKLLVGFDEPRNTVLYIDKPLKEHGLLQAIARVNRLFEDKEFGYIIDYRGVLGELNEAMETYNALEGYDPDDVEGTFINIAEEVARLPQLHSDLWDTFKSVPNRRDVEALQQFLAPEDVRQAFYDALTAYARCLKVALSAVVFYENTPEAQVETYKRDLRFFHNLRAAVKQRYAETIDYRDYELKIRKLLDSHIRSGEVATIVEPVDIFDAEAFQAEIEGIESVAARADTIAHRVKRTLTEYMERDPAFYARFSRLIDETIRAYREGRINEAEYLQRATEAMRTVQSGRDDQVPSKLHRYRDAPAYYGVIRIPLSQYTVASGTASGDGTVSIDDLAADIAIELERIIEANKIRDWTANLDVQKEIRRVMEDHLWEIRETHGLALSFEDMDEILDRVIEVARQRDQS